MITVIANLKGGSGKSTVSFNLAVWLTERGVGLKAIDLDPQRTFSDVDDVRKEEDEGMALGVLACDFPVVNGNEAEILIDVGAANPEGMREAMCIADRVIVPVPPSQPDIWATQRFLKMLGEARKDIKKKIDVIAFINRADTHHAVRESDDAAEALQQIKGIKFMPERLYSRTIYRRSMSEGLAVFELWRGSKAADEFEALASALYPGLAGDK